MLKKSKKFRKPGIVTLLALSGLVPASALAATDVPLLNFQSQIEVKAKKNFNAIQSDGLAAVVFANGHVVESTAELVQIKNAKQPFCLMITRMWHKNDGASLHGHLAQVHAGSVYRSNEIDSSQLPEFGYFYTQTDSEPGKPLSDAEEFNCGNLSRKGGATVNDLRAVVGAENLEIKVVAPEVVKTGSVGQSLSPNADQKAVAERQVSGRTDLIASGKGSAASSGSAGI